MLASEFQKRRQCHYFSGTRMLSLSAFQDRSHTGPELLSSKSTLFFDSKELSSTPRNSAKRRRRACKLSIPTAQSPNHFAARQILLNQDRSTEMPQFTGRDNFQFSGNEIRSVQVACCCLCSKIRDPALILADGNFCVCWRACRRTVERCQSPFSTRLLP
jgi:hypothetical protein